jgi:hypothetical protein
MLLRKAWICPAKFLCFVHMDGQFSASRAASGLPLVLESLDSSYTEIGLDNKIR